jgi:hypothetical protein
MAPAGTWGLTEVLKNEDDRLLMAGSSVRSCRPHRAGHGRGFSMHRFLP